MTRRSDPRVLSWPRVVVSWLAGEAVPIAVLAGLVALWGPEDPVQAGDFARRLGAWVGPTAGVLTLIVVGFWAGLASVRPVLQGALIGGLVALTDLTILVLLGEPLLALFLASNGLKILGGTVGGVLAFRSGRAATPDRPPPTYP